MKKYRTLSYLLTFIVLLGINVTCSKDDSGDTPEPTPQPDPEITIPSGEEQIPVVTDEGGTVTLKFTSATNWTLLTSADWVKPEMNAGKGGNQQIILTIQPNETPDERRATVTIQSGNIKRTVTITQKQKDALTLTVREQEIDASGGSFSIEIKSNIEFEVQISDQAWIHLIKSRALTTHTLSFQVDINESEEERVGEIVISGADLKETFTIRQEGKKSDEPEKPILNVSQKSFSLKADSGSLAFDVESNLEYDVEVGAGWISQDTVLSTNKHLVFTVKANTSTQERATTIQLTGGELVCIINVKQEGQEEEHPDDKPILNVSLDEIDIEPQGSDFELNIESNIEYTIMSNAEWVKHKTSQQTGTNKQEIFTVDANTSTEPRQAIITISGGGLTRTVTVKQKGQEAKPEEPVLNVSRTDFSVRAEGETLSFDVESNVEYQITIQDSWVKQITSKAVSTDNLSFTVEANGSTEARQSTITISGGGLTQIVTIKQEGEAPVLNIADSEFEMEASGGGVELNIQANVEYTITTSADWVKHKISQQTGTDKQEIFLVDANTSTEPRQAIITISGGGLTRTVTVKQKGQVPKPEEPVLNVSKTDFSVRAEGETLSFDVESNVEYQITIQDSWVKQITSKAVSTDNLSFTVEANDSTEARQSTITISGGGLTQIVTIKQEGEAPVLNIADSEFEMEASGGGVELNIQANVEYTITTSADWVKHKISQQTGTDKQEIFLVDANTSTEPRQAIITISGGGLTRTVTVKQKGQVPKPEEPVLNVSKTDFSVRAEGETLSFDVESNVEYQITIQDSWVKQITSKAVSTDNLSFTVEANDNIEDRQSTITISGGGLTQIVTIKQEGKAPVLNVADSEFEMEASGGGIELNIQTNVEYTITTSADWVKHKTSQQTGTNKQEIFTVDANTSTEPRQATITLAGGGLTRTVTVKQKGKEVPDGPTTGGTEDFKEEQENW
ncbi:BACON domain-containing protein [Parabacteroides pacaensis]|uniref:BACON domain-containing protein n=1 Tax=Parabacteroides pacaensis TaxID=2086575 RepID=UPI000D0F95C3|nr:BACON domain-containing protein [Parabacteroides pacaensis]